MVAEELFYYTYPFIFPDFLQQKLAKHEFEVVFEAVQVLTSENLEKVFLIEEYFKNYPSILSNSEKTKIKNYFIKIIEKLKEKDLILYINYVSDRNELGYKCLLDIECGNGLVLITDSTFVFVKDVACTAKGKTKVVILAVAFGLIGINPELGETFVNNSFNNHQVILAKSDGNPFTPPTNRGLSSFRTPPSVGRPIQPTYFAKYHVAPKLVDQGLGATSNPAGAGGVSGAVVPYASSVMLPPLSSELVTSRNSSNDLIPKVRGGSTGTDPKELAVKIMVLHHLMQRGISFKPPIRQVPQVGQVQRHPMGRPRMRRQEFLIGPRLEGPGNVGIGHEPLPASRLFAKHNPQGYNYDNQFKPIRIIHRIKEHPALRREAERMGKDQMAQKDVNNLIEQLTLGNESPGIGSEPIGGGISELRGFNEGRVYFRKLRKPTETLYEILGKSNKDNQKKVIALVKKHFL